MGDSSQKSMDSAAGLLRTAALLFENDAPALSPLNDLVRTALKASDSTVFRMEENGELTPAAPCSVPGGHLLDYAIALAGHSDISGGQTVSSLGGATTYQGVVLRFSGQAIGVWVVSSPDPHAWTECSEAIRPFLALGLQQLTWKEEKTGVKSEIERGMREVSAVYEIGQAIEKVDVNSLLTLITEKAAFVMDAQACSLMLRQPESDSLIIAASFGLDPDIVENTRIFVGQGIAGQVAASGEPLLLNALSDMQFDEPVEGIPGVSSSICMPMKDEDGDVLGVLCIRRGTLGSSFTKHDLRLFSIFATHAALALNNAKLYQKLNNRLQEISTLSALTQTISSTLDIDQVLNQVADNIVDIVKLDLCRIYLSDADTGKFSARIMRGFPQATPGKTEDNIGLGEGFIGTVAHSQEPILVTDLEQEHAAVRQYAMSYGLREFYAQPIVTRGRCIGVIVVSTSKPKPSISSNSIDLLSTFVHQAGIAIENARFYSSQERRYSELITLYEVSRNLAAASGVQKAAQTINDLATKITESDAGVLLLLDRAHNTMKVQDELGLSEELLDKLINQLSGPLPVNPIAHTLRAPRILTLGDVPSLLGSSWQTFCESFLSRHRATALVPMVVDNAAIGFLLLGKQNADYGVQELKLIAVASSQAAAVLHSATTYERQLGQRELELSAIYELMQKVRTATSLGEAVTSILDIVAGLVWSDRSLLYTVDENKKSITVRAAHGEDAASLIGALTIPLSGGHIAARALRERRGLISSTENEGRQNQTLSPLSPFTKPDASIAIALPGTLLAIPLLVGDELIGVLTMESHHLHGFDEESVKMLHLVTSQAATIYREMSLFRTLTSYTENILRSIAAGVITLNKDGYVVTCNKQAEKILNLSTMRIISCHYHDLIKQLQVEEHVRDETMRMIELTARTGKVFTRNRLGYHSPKGEETYVNLIASQLKSESGEYLGVVVVFEDVTSEVLMQEEVERVTKLAETGQLAANIAHELRNPLSSIKGAAQLLRNELPEGFVQQHGEFLDIIVEEANGLNRMTTEFLEFSRVAPPQMRETSLNLMLLKLLQFMNTYLTEQKVAVTQIFDEVLPNVIIDKSQTEQVVRNIIINAVQAMPLGGELIITTRYMAQHDMAEVEFTDTGAGIPAGKTEKIFAPFFTTKTKGTGLGLAIAKKIVETHGGKLKVRSAPGAGSTFTIHLPVHPEHTGMVQQQSTEITEQRSDRPGSAFNLPEKLEVSAD